MTLDQKKVEVYKAYPGEKWKIKVNSMSDGQILAIYNNLVSKGRIK